MYRKILVPLDGSNFSTGVLPFVRSLAGALRLPVELLSVSDPALLVSYAPPTVREFLGTAAKSFPASTRLSQTIENGSAAQVIIDKAHTEAGTLVAMATHGYSGAARWLLGSVAEKVTQSLTTDLLLVRPAAGDAGGDSPLKTILLPLDYSAIAEAILPAAAELGRSLDSEMVLIHVTRRFYPGPPETLAPAFGAIPNLKELWEQDTAEAERYLHEKAQQLHSQGCVRVSSRVLAGGVDGAAGAIIDLAQKVPDSLIAMTPDGQSGIGRWLMGSVTRRVIQHAGRPVLVMRPPRPS